MDIYMGGGGDDVYIRLFVFSSEIEGCDICAWRWTVAVVIHPSHTHTPPVTTPPNTDGSSPDTHSQPPPSPPPPPTPGLDQPSDHKNRTRIHTSTIIYRRPIIAASFHFFFPPPVVGWSEKQLTWFQNFVGKNEGRETERRCCVLKHCKVFVVKNELGSLLCVFSR